MISTNYNRSQQTLAECLHALISTCKKNKQKQHMTIGTSTRAHWAKIMSFFVCYSLMANFPSADLQDLNTENQLLFIFNHHLWSSTFYTLHVKKVKVIKIGKIFNVLIWLQTVVKTYDRRQHEKHMSQSMSQTLIHIAASRSKLPQLSLVRDAMSTPQSVITTVQQRIHFEPSSDPVQTTKTRKSK